MTLLFSLGAALCYGLADFVGGVGSKRTSPPAVALIMQVSGAAAVAAYAVVAGGHPSGHDYAWAVAGGLANGFGTAFLYRGLAHGRMGVVAPVSAVGAAALPVLIGVALGERPAVAVWLGIAVGLPGIWLVSQEPSDEAAGRSGLLDGILAGIGFGGMFAALAQVPRGAGLMPVALNELVAGAVIVAIAVGMSADWRPSRAAAGHGLTAGVLASAATAFFLAATHAGLLAVAAIITSLYPALTVILAATVIEERIHRPQAAGLALCLGSIALVASG